MQKSPLLLIFLGLTLTLQAQLTIPKTSPEVITQHDLAFTTIKVHYHSPAVQGREIWGKLVPYNDPEARPWRAGANNTTVVSFSEDVLVEGQPLPAGQYGLHMIPADGAWTIIFSKKWEGWGSYQYDPAQDALRVEVTPEEIPPRDDLAYTFSDRAADGITLALEWEKVRVPLRVTIDLEEQVFQRMEKQLNQLTGDKLPDALATAAYYCLANDVQLERGLEYAERGIRYGKTYLLFAYQSDILIKLGREAEAKKARINGYRLLPLDEVFQRALNNLANRDEAGAREKFEYIVGTAPKAWYGYESKARLLHMDGDAREAGLWLMKALEEAPETEKERMEALEAEWEKQ